MTSLQRILLVEDEPVDRMAFERTIEARNLAYSVTAAPSCRQAESLLSRSRFDAAVLDYRLGDGTALDLIPLLDDTPFVITTGRGGERVAVETLKAGALDYIVKDLDGEYLDQVTESLQRVLAAAPSDGNGAVVRGQDIGSLFDLLLIRNRRMERILEAVDHLAVIAVFDAGGNLIYANNRLCQVSGWSALELIGRDRDHVGLAWPRTRDFHRMLATARGGRIWRGQISGRAKSGFLFWIDAVVMPYLDERGEVAEYVAAGMDISFSIS